MKNKILGLLGICARSRNIILGEFVLKEISEEVIVFLASDAGNNLKKKIKDKVSFYNALLVEDFTTDELSKAIGKSNRKVVLIKEQGFVKTFKSYIS